MNSPPRRDVLRFGLIGTGYWRPIAIELVRSGLPFSVARVWSRRLEKADEVAQQLQDAGGRECRGIRSWEEIDGLDGVLIALPPSEMPGVLLGALQRRVPAIVEKPVGPGSESVEDLRRAADVSGVPVAVHCQGRFVPVMHALRTRALSSTYGAVREVDVHSFGNWNHPAAPTPHSWKHAAREGGGILGVSGPHAAEFVLGLAGPGRPRAMCAWTELPERRDAEGRLLPCTAPDNALIVGEHADGVRSTVRLSSTSRKRQEVWTVRCSDGTLRMTAAGTLALLGNDGADETLPCSREEVLSAYGIVAQAPLLSVPDSAFASAVFVDRFLRWIEDGVNECLPDLRTMASCWSMLEGPPADPEL